MGICEGKVALVTGSSRGIGRAIALELAGKGTRVVLCSRSRKALQQVKSEIVDRGGDALTIVADVGIPSDVDGMVDAAIEYFGRLDILVNNAGITRDNLLMRLKEEDWDAVINTNLKGAYNCSKAVVRPMLKSGNGGRIINIASVVGMDGNAGQANYAAAKAGLIGLTKTLAKELGSRRITVNAIAPGLVLDTGMTSELSKAVSEQFLEQVPLGRAATPDDVAYAVAFLASERAAYITGEILRVDGGMAM